MERFQDEFPGMDTELLAERCQILGARAAIQGRVGKGFKSMTAADWKDFTLEYSLYALHGVLPAAAYNLWKAYVQATFYLTRRYVCKPHNGLMRVCRLSTWRELPMEPKLLLLVCLATQAALRNLKLIRFHLTSTIDFQNADARGYTAWGASYDNLPQVIPGQVWTRCCPSKHAPA